ncbi:hypothetical protein K470DRAFT_221571 [Piedraia hortae CBS 480.64]|uniref:Phosphatidate phosphatase APP1 catalytic domain-containing protein n=1 Tax=Piedraia hortae CBS 480.64 TaxID=1314780 RepID=A0A6A7BU70_9PEZI|nr:hypothetical protein K470DRAFT_221571 [Piedraia hortae CBS 480.64]
MIKVLERAPGLDLIKGKTLVEIGGKPLLKVPEDERRQAFDIAAEVVADSVKRHYVPPIKLGPHEEATVKLSSETTFHGEFDEFAELHSLSGPPDSDTACVKRIRSRVSNAIKSQADIFFVPPKGITIVSDIDAVLRVSQYMPRLKESAFKPYRPWLNMPQIFAKFKTRCDIHFHYITNAPSPFTDMYMRFLVHFYPPGSFDAARTNVRFPSEVNLNLILEKFPNRKFYLLLDMTKRYRFTTMAPSRLECILIRDIAPLNYREKFKIANLKENWKFIPKTKIRYFTKPDDLMGLDFDAGGCGIPKLQKYN